MQNLDKKRVLALFALIILSLGIGVGIYLVGQRQEIRKKAANNQVGLNLTSDQASLTAGQSFNVNVVVNPPTDGSLKVSAISTKVLYPADKLTLNQATVGNFFLQNFTSGQTEMLNKIDTTTAGVVAILLGAPCRNAAPLSCFPQTTGGSTFPLASLNFTVKAGTSGTAQVSFDTQNTAAAALDINNSAANNNQNIADPSSFNSLSLPISTQSSPSPTPSAKRGDVNRDGVVNIVDIGIIIDHYGESPPGDPRADLNHDGIVNIVDIGIVIDNYGN